VDFYATPYYCLRQLGCLDASVGHGGKNYDLFRNAINRLSAVHYRNDRFYDPIRGEHRDVAFGFLSYSLPLDADSSRAWRFAWDPIFFEFCSATGGTLRFDFPTYRRLDEASDASGISRSAYSLVEGSTVLGIIDSNSAGGGMISSYTWTVPATLNGYTLNATDYKILVAAWDASPNQNMGGAESSGYITIQPAGPVTVISPNGGENWPLGVSHTITWSVTGNTSQINNFLVSYSLDGGTTYQNDVGTASSTASSISWTPPLMISTTAVGRIRVEARNASNSVLSQDVSDGTFTFNNAVNGFGKGDWIWVTGSTESAIGVTTVQGVIDYEKKEGMHWIAVKAGDGNSADWASSNSFAEFVTLGHAAGLRVYAWVYAYGGGYVPAWGSTVTGEIAVANNALGLGADGLIIDAEQEYENLGSSAATNAATQYCQGIRASYPTTFLAYSSFPIISLHTAFPYLAFGKYCNATMPQDYWADLATYLNSIGLAATPANMVAQMDTEWTSAQNAWAASGHADSVKPIYPVAQGNSSVTGSDVVAFVNSLESDPTPATAGGYQGVSFWSAQSHTADIWSGIGAVTIGSTTTSPVLKVSPTSLTLPTTTQTMAGNTTSFTVSGSGLGSGDTLTLWAPTGSEISKDGSSFFNSVLLYPDASGNLSTTQGLVYIRTSKSAKVNVSGNLTVQDYFNSSLDTSIPVSGTVQPTPTLNVTFPAASATVGTTGSSTVTFTVGLNVSLTSDLLVPYQTENGSATAGTDYDAASGTLDIPAGQSTGSLTVNVHGAAALGDRTFFLVLSDPSGYVLSTHSACGTIHTQVSPAEIGGLVWNDLNDNGSPDSGEPGLAGWTVALHAAFQPDQTATTDANGWYSFPGLAAGTYTLSIVAPAGWNLVTPVGGTLLEIISAGSSVDNADFGCQIQPAIVGQNYAVLFSGGADPADNHSRYYDNIKSLYHELITGLGLNPANIYILYADGTDPAADQSTLFLGFIPWTVNSDMSFVDPRSTVEAATKSNLQDLLTQLAGKIGSQDHLLFWTFDHGSKVNTGNDSANQDDHTEYLVPWLDGNPAYTTNLISNQELDTWLNGIHAGYTTYVFNQCFAGGMFDDLNLTGNTFGCAAASYYETSQSDYFAAAFTDALQNGLDTGEDAFSYAFAHDKAEKPGGGPAFIPVDGYEHPWDAGGNFPIFATASCPSVNNLAITPLQFDPSLAQVTISYDMLLASLGGLPGSNAGLNFCIESVDSGTLSLNGQTVQPGVTQLPPGQSLTWTRSASGSGQVNAFHVSVWENDQQLGSSVGVDLSFSSPNSLTAAVNDSATVAENAPATAIDVLANDTGLGTLSVLQVGAAQHGYVTLQNGQVLYQPDPDYSGPDGFSYTMADESNTTSLASVVVTVTAVPQNPQTIFHLFQVTTGTTALLDVSQGDYDPDGTAVTLTAVAAAQHGTVQLVNGQAQYTPATGYVGADQFGYTIADGNGGTAGGIAYVTVAPTPVFSNLSTSSSIAYGTASVAFSGTISAGTLIPPSTEVVAVTLSGVTQDAAIDSQGDFSTSFNTSQLPASATPYQVTYAYAGDANFNTVSDNTTTTLIVNKATPAITWSTPAAITYGTALSIAQLDAIAGVGGTTYSYSPALGTVLHAGVQTLQVTFTPRDTTDYTTGTASVILTVSKAVLSVTADSKSRIYGAALPTLTASYSGWVNGDTPASLTTPPTLTTMATAASHFGSYPITASGAVDADYTIGYVAGTLSVTAAPLTITANSQTKQYGAALPKFTASYSGFVNGDTSASLTTPPSFSTTATVASHFGNYTITASGAVDRDYTFNYASGTLTVTAVPLTITANNQSKVYGAALPSLIASYSGFVNGDNSASLTTLPSLSTTATSASHVGSFPIQAAGAVDPNYSISYVSGTLTVTPVPVAISVAPLVTNIGFPVIVTGTAVAPSPNAGIASVSLVVNAQTMPATVSGNTWSANLGILPTGTYNVQVTATDNAGNSSTVTATRALVVNAGTTFGLSGTSFSFTGGATPASWTILVNGSKVANIPAGTTVVNFTGTGSSATATITGASATGESVAIAPGQATFIGVGSGGPYEVTATNLFSATVTSGGSGSLSVTNTTGGNILTELSTATVLANASNSAEAMVAKGFNNVIATATGAGSSAVANLFGSNAADTFTANPQSAVMQDTAGTSYRLEADGFTTVRGTGGVGRDTALLTDAAGGALNATGTNATLSGTGYSITANNFASVQAIAVGPSDAAHLQAGTGSNVFVGSKGKSELRGVNYDNIASGFFTVSAYGASVGYNTAVLTDSTGNATAAISPQTATLTDASARGPASYQINLASGFQVIQAFETSLVGSNTAILKGSSTAANSFTSTSTNATLAPLTGNTYREYVQGFAAVQATSTYATDTAYLFDSLGSGTFTATPNSATMSLLGGKSVVAAGFKTVNAYSKPGGTGTANLTGTAGTDNAWLWSTNALMKMSTGNAVRAWYFAKYNLDGDGGSGDTVTTMDASVLPTKQTTVAGERIIAWLANFAWMNQDYSSGSQNTNKSYAIAVDEVLTAYWS
jgi:hypothetical protein